MPSHEEKLELLDSLIQFYHKEREWIHNTRSSLDDAAYATPSLPSPPHTDSDSDPQEESPNNPPTPPTSLWSRRKRRLHLRLDSPSPHKRRAVTHRDLAHKKKILDMLDRVMQARIESCKSINQIVQNAHWPGLDDADPA